MTALPELARLVHPVAPETFLRDHWEQQPLLVERDEPDRYDLLTLDDVDTALALTGAGLDRLRVVIDGRETPVAELAAALATTRWKPSSNDIGTVPPSW
jgi:hypothetical protein